MSDLSSKNAPQLVGFDPDKFKIEISMDDTHGDMNDQKQDLKNKNLNLDMSSGNSPQESNLVSLGGQGTQGSQYMKGAQGKGIGATSPEADEDIKINFNHMHLGNTSQTGSPSNQELKVLD